MNQERTGKIVCVLAAAIGLLATSLPVTALARSTAPETWRYDMVQTWYSDRPGAKRHTRLARIWVKGKKMRREEGNLITIIADGWQYNLQKDKKEGIKQPAPKDGSQALSNPSPSGFARHAQKYGKKIRTEPLAGQTMTVYQLEGDVRVWVGSDGLVRKTGGRYSRGGVWWWEMRNLRRGVTIPDSMFRPPAGYKVRAVLVLPSPSSKMRKP